MLVKFLFISMITSLILDMGYTYEANGKEISSKNSLINKFCIASLKSKLKFKDKKKLNEISHFTCECFYKKFKSGNSIRSSRIYCKNKAVEKYDL